MVLEAGAELLFESGVLEAAEELLLDEAEVVAGAELADEPAGACEALPFKHELSLLD